MTVSLAFGVDDEVHALFSSRAFPSAEVEIIGREFGIHVAEHLHEWQFYGFFMMR